MTSLRLGLLVVLAVSAAARGAAVQDSLEVHEMGATALKLTPFDDLDDANVLGEASPTTNKSDVNCTKPEKSAAEQQGAKEAEVTNAMASMGVNATSLGPNVTSLGPNVTSLVPNVTTANKTSSNSSRQEDTEKWAMNKTGVNVSEIGLDAASSDAGVSSKAGNSSVSSKAGNSSKSSEDIVAEVAAKDAAENNVIALARDSKPAEQLVKEFSDQDAKNSNASEAKAGLGKTKLSSNATDSAEDSNATAMAGENATDTNITTANVTMSPADEAAAANASATKAKEQEAVMASMNMTKKDIYKQNDPMPCDTENKTAPAAPSSATPPPPPEAPSNPPVHVVQAEQELDNDEPKA